MTLSQNSQTEIYPKEKRDRRLAPNIPGRGASRRAGHQRYQAELQISVFDLAEESTPLRCISEDVSPSGVLLSWPEGTPPPKVGENFVLRFTMPPGTLPEGYEARIRMQAEVVRVVTDDGNTKVAFNFAYELNNYLRFNTMLSG